MKKYLPSIGLFLLALSAQASSLPAGNAVTLDDVSNLIGLAMDFLIIMSVTVAVIYIALAGITVMNAQGNPAAAQKGYTRLRHAMIGFGVVLAAGVIINTVAAIVDRSFFCSVSVGGVCLFK